MTVMGVLLFQSMTTVVESAGDPLPTLKGTEIEKRLGGTFLPAPFR
jgi:hypothetical protein